MKHSLVLRAALCAASVTASLSAQTPAAEPRMVPVDVARAGLGPMSEMIGPLSYASGEVPPGWPSALVPGAPARTVGGVAAKMFATALFSFPTTPTKASARVRTLLTQAGWREGHHRQAPIMSLEEVRRPPDWCNGNDFLSFGVADSTPRSSTIKIILMNSSTGAYSRDCRETDASRTFRVGAAIEPPRLEDPPGVPNPVGSLGFDSDGSASVNASLRTTLPPGALLPHYATQMSADGWTARPALVASDIAVQTFEKTTAGKRFLAVLQIVAHATTREMTMRITALK